MPFFNFEPCLLFRILEYVNKMGLTNLRQCVSSSMKRKHLEADKNDCGEQGLDSTTNDEVTKLKQLECTHGRVFCCNDVLLTLT